MKSRLLRAATLVMAVLLVALSVAASRVQPAAASPGDLLAEVTTPEGTGLLWARGISPSVGFDGRFLYYVEYAGSVLHRIDVPPAGGSSPATGQLDVPITGAASGIMSIAYDAGRDSFWAVGGDGLSVYSLSKSGSATLAFRVDPLNDRPGFQLSLYPAEIKVAYDRSDDTIWYSADATTRIYHYRTTADLLGTAVLVTSTPYVDVDMTAECGFSQSSGVAVGGPDLFVSISGCPLYFEFTKTGAKVGSFAMSLPSAGDIECDSASYGVSVIWVKDEWGGRIQAYEQPSAGACVTGGGDAAP
jgi:hypothetical protein